MTDDAAQVLASCLDAIEQQGLSLEECIARYPDQRLALCELLPAAQALRSAPGVTPSLDFRMDARQRLAACLPARQARRAKWFPRRGVYVQAALALLMVGVLATSVVTASARALPNDLLYPAKRTIEQVRLAFASDHLRNGDLRLAFAAERLHEVERLIDMGRGADAAAAIEEFSVHIQSAVSIVQTSSDTPERAALLARVAELLRSSDAALSNVQDRLPESAQAAVTRARALLAERRNDLRSTPPPGTPTEVASATPGRKPTRRWIPSLVETLPAARVTLSSALPILVPRPASPPVQESTPRPNVGATRQPPRTTSVPSVVLPAGWPPFVSTHAMPYCPGCTITPEK